MKKLFLGAAIAMGSLAFAQQFGIKGGANFSTISGDADFDNANTKTGFYAGLFMNAPLAESFSIQPEILYNNLGAKQEVAGTDVKMNLDYISVPVMFQYNATPAFYLEAGPQFGFLTSAKLKANDNESSDFKDNLNGFDFGVGLGAGYYFTPNIGLTARYVAGFTDILDEEAFGSDASAKNNTFQLGLAYKF